MTENKSINPNQRINENTLIQLSDGTVITYDMYIRLLQEKRGF